MWREEAVIFCCSRPAHLREMPRGRRNYFAISASRLWPCKLRQRSFTFQTITLFQFHFYYQKGVSFFDKSSSPLFHIEDMGVPAVAGKGKNMVLIAQRAKMACLCDLEFVYKNVSLLLGLKRGLPFFST